jgi:hypothetical protein
MHLKRVVTDGDVRPDALHQCGFGNQFSGCFDENLYDVESAGGDGVAVTPLTKPLSDVPTPPTTNPNPRTPTYRIPALSARTAAMSARRMIQGIPPPRWIGRWPASRLVPGARGLTLTGAGRPVDGGRGRTWVGRWSRRVVIGTAASFVLLWGIASVPIASLVGADLAINSFVVQGLTLETIIHRLMIGTDRAGAGQEMGHGAA